MSHIKPRPEEIKRFQSLLERRGLKFTQERTILLSEVVQQRKHFDADEFYASLKEKGVRVSRDTVYRTLPLLLECGVLQKSVGDGRREYFERISSKGHHDHMVCIRCGHVIEFHSDEIEKYQTKICKELGFELIFHDHRLFGHCQKCVA